MVDHDAVADWRARQVAVDPDRSVIVQAPAGSGKTALLVERFLRLLARVDEPEQILAITFTRKAAAEMRERIAAAIDAAAAPPGPGATSHECELRALARKAREHGEVRGWCLDLQLSRLRIMTIDALGHWLARHQPVHARLGCDPELVKDPAPLYREAAQRTVAALEFDAAFAPALESVIRLLDGDIARTVQQIAALLARRDLWLPRLLAARGSADRRAASEDLRAAVIVDELQAARDALPEMALRRLIGEVIAGVLVDTPVGGRLEALRGSSELPAAAVEDLSKWRALTRLLLTGEGTPRRKLTVREGFPPSARSLKSEALDLIATLTADTDALLALRRIGDLPAPRYPDSEWQQIEALEEVLIRAAAELQQVFAAQGRIDHAAVAAAARDALGTEDEPAELMLMLDYRVHHLLVDEFQDTSAAQSALLRRLVGEWSGRDGRSLFCVGDPMQSIYGFREAEVGLFLEARRHGVGSVRLENVTLAANFRSSPSVLEWINAGFSRLLPPRDDFARGAVAHAPCVATRSDRAGDGVRVHAFVDADETTAAQRVVDVVRESLQGDDGGGRSVAILVRSRGSLPPILEALGRAGIAWRGVDVESLADRMAVRDVVALACALLHSGDRTAWLSVLRAPWCGVALADLEVIADAAVRTVPDLLGAEELPARLSPDGALRVQRLREALEPVVRDRGRTTLGTWLQSAWLALDGPATVEAPGDLRNLRLCFAAFDQLERECGPQPEASELEAAVRRVQASSGEAAEASVDVMTIHRAKGLEFDVVIMPDLDRTARKSEGPLLQWQAVTARGGAAGVLFAPRPSVHERENRRRSAEVGLHAWLGGLDSDRGRYELGRLAYVATTRARRRLHLIGRVASRGAGDGRRELVPPSERSLLGVLWPAVECEFSAALGAMASSASNAPDTAQSRAPGADAIARLRLPVNPPPALPDVPRPVLALRAIAGGVVQPAFDWAGELAGRIGTVLHAELHRICRGELGIEQCRLPARKEIWRQELLAAGVASAAVPEAVARVGNALATMQNDPLGRRLLSRDWSEQGSEFALSGVIEGRLVSVRIDRTFVDADGCRWIVDWKSSRHEGGELDSFLQNEMSRHASQLRLYAELLREIDGRPQRIGLYFPALARWCEYRSDA